MAGLKKPERCECGSVEMHREYHPERWVCNKCSKIIASREPRPQSGVCRDCGKLESEVPFDKHGNICKACKAVYNKQYGVDHKVEIREHHKNYYAKNKEKIREQANTYWQSDWEPFLSDRFHSAENGSTARMDGKKRKTPLEFSITREFVYELAKKQEYKCAMSGVPLLHEWGHMRSGSIDRIDSSKGYIPGNVQLVCKAINLMKNDHSVEEVQEFIRMMREAGNVQNP